MRFKNHSKNVVRVVGEDLVRGITGDGVRKVVDRYVSQRTEKGQPTSTRTREVMAEIEPGAEFDVKEEYAMPRLVRGRRAPGPFEEMVGCPGCDDPTQNVDHVISTMSGPQKVKKHLEHPVCLPVDDAERAMWMEAPAPQVDPRRLSQFERDEQLIRENAALKDDTEQMRREMEELKQLVASLAKDKQASPKAQR